MIPLMNASSGTNVGVDTTGILVSVFVGSEKDKAVDVGEIGILVLGGVVKQELINKINMIAMAKRL